MPARLRVLAVGVAIPVALWFALPMVTHGQSDRQQRLDEQIGREQRTISRQERRERRLQRQIARYNGRIGRLDDRLGGLQARHDALQADLDGKLAELASIQEQLRSERARLVRLRARLARSRRILADRLVELYKAEEPDAVTVILSANGFADLLERSEFVTRVGRQDRRIITRVQTDKEETIRTARRLARLERRQKTVVSIVASRRNEVRSLRDTVQNQRDFVASVRGARRDLLGRTRAARQENEEDLAAMERASARIAARLAGASAGGPPRRGSGGLLWPINGSVSSPFGQRWGRLHAGIDIPGGVGTPIRAAKGGRVVIAGPQGGYGNYTCIDHGGGMSTCYAHQSRIGVSTGQSVSGGQVIGDVGNTGNSTGPHLHFEVRINGNPVDPMGYL